ncbi:MAG: hypothetical protein RR141_05085 [Rikenellaceae bacterium]
MRKLHHFGIPTQIKREGESYSEDMRLFLTDPMASINKIEFLRFEKESQMPDILKTHAHVAYEIDDFATEMAGKKVVMEVTKLSDHMSIAFIEEDGIAIELIKLS